MSDVERLTAELDLARKVEKLEAARTAMHADRSPKAIKAYKAACRQVNAARQAFREEHRVASTDPADASPAVKTVRAKVGVKGA